MTTDTQSKNKIIVKNTLIMYGRMLAMLFLSLFTARIVFKTLGIDNYGIYNLVGGIIVFFSFLNSALTAATKRYITTDIAKGNDKTTSKTFYNAILAHCLIALVIFILAETVGLYVVNGLLNIPADRMIAANWVYQLSVITAILGIMQSPFNAAIVAYEKMGAFAWMTIFDAVFKLLIVYLVQVLPGDILISYTVLVFVVSIMNMIIYRVYTFYLIPTTHLRYRIIDKYQLKEMFGFMGWSMLGQACVVATTQGVGVLINVYYSVAVNAAMGVSNSITNVINGFVSNFQTAFNPQIIKSYVSKEYDYLQSLMIRTSKLSSFLILIFLIPLLFESDKVLYLWLDDYPQYAQEFCIYTLVVCFIEAISAPLWMMIYAQTNIKKYQIVTSVVYSQNFIIGWIALALGATPYSVIIVRIAIFLVLTIIRLMYTKRFFPKFDYMRWLNEVVLKSLIIFGVASSLTGATAYFLPLGLFAHIVVTTLVSLMVTLPMIYMIGLSMSEKTFVLNLVNIKFLRR